MVPGALPGRWYAGNEHTLLIACTEKNTETQIESLAAALGEII
jgi:hypothetical protein